MTWPLEHALALLARARDDRYVVCQLGADQEAPAYARADSDLDLLVVEPNVPDRFGEMARLATLLGRRLIPADVVVMSSDAFERQKTVINTLAWRAAREGQAYDLAA